MPLIFVLIRITAEIIATGMLAATEPVHGPRCSKERSGDGLLRPSPKPSSSPNSIQACYLGSWCFAAKPLPLGSGQDKLSTLEAAGLRIRRKAIERLPNVSNEVNRVG